MTFDEITEGTIEDLTDEQIEGIAKQCHENNRTFCNVNGDPSQKRWNEAEDWQRDSAIEGVKAFLANPSITPEEIHEDWAEKKRKDGWVYGEVKDAEKKTHPCLVPYEELSFVDKEKDRIFRDTVERNLRLLGVSL